MTKPYLLNAKLTPTVTLTLSLIVVAL